MRVVGFNGSARKGGNTSRLISVVFEELEKQGIETELVEMAGKQVKGCIGCRKCAKNKNKKCVFDDDFANECIAKMDEADAIILGSPSYFSDVTANMKALIERAGVVNRSNDSMFRRKPGAGIAAERRCGAYHVLSTLNAFFTITEMFVVGSSYWNMGRGLMPGDVDKDDEGIKTMRDLGVNMAWLLKKLKA